MTNTALEVRLASRPKGWPTEDNFELAEVEVPTPGRRPVPGPQRLHVASTRTCAGA